MTCTVISMNVIFQFFTALNNQKCLKKIKILEENALVKKKEKVCKETRKQHGKSERSTGQFYFLSPMSTQFTERDSATPKCRRVPAYNEALGTCQQITYSQEPRTFG